MKKFMSGLIIGIIFALSMTAFTNTELAVNINPFPILVNGAREEIAAYNINGSTYIGLRDIGRATSEIINVGFDDNSRVINIDASLSNMEVNELDRTILEQIQRNRIPEYVRDDIFLIEYNEEEYISYSSVRYYAGNVVGYGPSLRDDENGNIYIVKDQRNPNTFKLENIPYIEANGTYYIPLDYYNTNPTLVRRIN